jgi:hypothetical protein
LAPTNRQAFYPSPESQKFNSFSDTGALALFGDGI